MGMQDKEKLFSRIVNISLILLFVNILAYSFFHYPDAIYFTLDFIISFVIYGIALIKVYSFTGRAPVVLILLFIGSVGFRIYSSLSPSSTALDIVSLIILYTYFILSGYFINGRVSKFSLFLGGLSIVNIAFIGYVDNWYARVFVSVFQVIIILKLLNPLMEKVGERGKMKREEEGIDYSNVSTIRRILFGKTGKLRVKDAVRGISKSDSDSIGLDGKVS